MSDTTAPQKSGGIRDLGKMFGGGQSSLRQFGILGALIAIIIVFQILTGGKTLQPGNVINIVLANSYVLILAIGMVMVIIAGHIDLSVGSIAAFVGIIVAISMNRWDFPWPAAILLGLVVGALIGAWQGFWVAYVGVPAFIVTLAGMLLFRGANQFVGRSTTEPIANEAYRQIGGGYLPDPAWGVPLNLTTLVLGVLAIAAVIYNEISLRRRQAKIGAEMAPVWVSGIKIAALIAVIVAASLLFASGRPGQSLPISGVILIALVLVYSFVTNHTIIGRHIYSLGGNSHAAELSGVKIKRVNFFVMMNMSILAAVAGMVFISRSRSSGPLDGNSWELDAIAAVFIGGAAVSGGIGTVIGSIVGGLVIAVLNNGLQLLSVGADRVQMIKGLVLLLAVAVDVLSKRSGRPSILGRFGRGKPSDAGDPLTVSTPMQRPEVVPGEGGPDASSRPPSTTPNA
ncbi:multiple monosaccharide ABC transporter permease [Homoserinibacter sp. YIM 151385]|uniref:multiple monosaccharide ABC transporter permease n=1 Tax=Homoserinibacter sp. YIM 151385 TaxID=2985506 RepID=UPI0022F050BC|nr:multiple monosaccharide ABC transporter permease [Homoserinibacter sp. YIM 151385]WBU36918.1 sugar ABC transporter permease [Homoserinibacter sp. YIM 151385]